MTFWKMMKSPNGAVSGGSSRREFIGGAAAAGAVATVAAASPAIAAGPSFVHGVASGDPLATKVIIWTRVSGRTRSTSVRWMVARDAGFTQVVKQGTKVTNAAADYTVKVDVAGLTANTVYFYKFQVDSVTSPVGRTRTLPTGSVDQVKFAIFSCSAFEVGFFNAYKEAATYDDLNAVIHLGDYIYEYGRGLGLAGENLVQSRFDALQPKSEIVVLADYRSRHATYRSDPDLQALTAKNPLIAVYDDHEVTNDGWREGAENHQPPAEGDWDNRKRMALQAYYEWMPVRGGPGFDASVDPQGLYRVFDFGTLARLVMIDTRLAGRDLQLDATSLIATYGGLRADTLDGTPATRPRSLLGTPQATFLAQQLATSTQTWQVIGNQILAFYQPAADVLGSTVLSQPLKDGLIAALNVLFGPALTQQLLLLAASPTGIPSPLATDAWTGYPTARAELLGTLAQAARNPIIITGDSHNAWTANLKIPFGGTIIPVAPEFGATSVTSGGFESFLPGFPPAAFAALLVETSGTKSPFDKLIYTNQSERGFLLLTLTPTQTTASHIFVSTVKAQSYTTVSQNFTVAVNTRTAVAV